MSPEIAFEVTFIAVFNVFKLCVVIEDVRNSINEVEVNLKVNLYFIIMNIFF